MRLRAFIKLSLKVILKGLPTFIFVFIIFPIALGVMHGYFQKDFFSPPNYMNKISIIVEDRDKSEVSKEFQKFLSTGDMKGIIKVDCKNWEYKLVVPKGYERELKASMNCKIDIICKNNKSEVKENMMIFIVNKYHKLQQQQIFIDKKIKENFMSNEEKLKLMKEVSEYVDKLYKSNLIENNIISKDKSLTSYEYYSISIFASFMFIMLISSLSAGYYEEKDKGIFSRILSTNLTKIQYFNCSLTTFFITSFILNLIYVLVYKILGLSFSGSISLLLLIVLLQSLLTAIISGSLIAFCKDIKVLKAITVICLMLTTVIGGVFWPVEKFNSDLIKSFSIFSPNMIVFKTYEKYLLYNDLNSIKLYLILFLVISIILYCISIVKVKWKWGE